MLIVIQKQGLVHHNCYIQYEGIGLLSGVYLCFLIMVEDEMMILLTILDMHILIRRIF